ncbi:MAG: hypothetical protein ACRDWD_00465 [Acidimicrobiia bacterium]
MPWCATCSRFLSPPTVRADGACPECGNPVDPGPAQAASPPDEKGRMPWHFWLLAGAVALYLGWRAFQGIEWVWHQVVG